MKLNKEGDVISHEMIGRGLWAVTGTCTTGGGYGHGPGDVYPDGHQLTLRKINRWGHIEWKKPVKKFFQSGCFNQILPYCKPISRL